MMCVKGCSELAAESWYLAAAMQVTTFKLRTVRAKREIESLASRWAQGSDNNLDDAAGGCQQLLARALSSAAASAILNHPCRQLNCARQYLLCPICVVLLWAFAVQQGLAS